MSSVEKRPYAGNWSSDIPNKYRKVTTWTPDAIVKMNGETALPGCRECDNKIDFQSFITSANVNGSLDSLSADISMTIPKHYGDSIFKDGAFVFQTGVEIHIYYRGFFPTDNLAEKDDVFNDDETGDEYDLSKVQMRPYYPVFHGVVTNVSYSYASGFYNASLSCASMLHFWENQKINTNASYLASSPTESRGSVRLDGHVYTNMTPHQIIYDLYRDTGGSADGLESTLGGTKTNVRAKTSGGTDFFSLAMRYWERRFSQGLYGLKMFGASGKLYSATEQAFITNLYRGKRLDKELLAVQRATLDPTQNAKTSTAFARGSNAGVVSKTGTRVNRNLDISLMAQASGKDSVGVLTTQLKAFITDYGNIGNISLFSTSYESKKQIASTVAEKTGYEFYQDFDGDLVFKPPLYNLDTSSSRIYRILPEDVISLSFTHNEPEATYVVCKGGPFRNVAGLGLEGEMGIRSTYVDYRLVAKYGWKSYEFDTTFYNDREQAYYASVVKLDEINKNVNTASLTIPLRPEIKMGYPVYVEHIDTFYYVTSVSHSFSFGGSCTTTLELTARRKRFMPSGSPTVSYSEDPKNAVDFERTFLPPKALYKEIEGLYRVTGFPNVVMALDTTKLDPSYLYFPLDYTMGGSSNPTTAKMFRNMVIMEGYRLKVLKLKNPNQDDVNSQLEDRFFLGPWNVTLPNEDGSEIKEAEIKLDSKGAFNGESALNKLNNATKKTRKDASLLNKKGRFSESKKLREIAQQEYETKINKLRALTRGSNELTIVDLIDTIKYASSKSGEGIPPSGSTSSIIALLSNKKSSFNPNQPGYYRYYSSSHPDPDSQAPHQINVDNEGDVSLSPVNIERPDATKNNMVVSIGEDDKVVFQEIAPKRGLKTKTLYNKVPEIVPTKDILTLSFMTNEVKVVRKRTGISINSSLKPSEYIMTLKSNLKRELEKKHKNGIRAKQLNALIFKSKKTANGTALKNGASKLYGSDSNPIADNTEIKKTDIPVIANETIIKTYEFAVSDYPNLVNTTDENALKTDLGNFIKDLKTIYKNPSVLYSKKVKKGKISNYYEKTSFISPIFPISDENGYEVFGSYQYGRGLDILPNNSFNQLLKQDPTKVFTEEELNEFLKTLYSNSTQNAREELAKKAVERLTQGVEDEQNRQEIEKIASGLGLNASTRNDLVTQLSNAIIKKNDVQVIGNVPSRRTEIRPESRGDAQCDCRGHDDDLFLTLLNSESEFISTSSDLESDVVLTYRDLLLQKAQEWEYHQKALKGEQVSFNNPLDVIKPLVSGGGTSSFGDLGSNVEVLYEQTLGQELDNLNTANENAREEFRQDFADALNERKRNRNG